MCCGCKIVQFDQSFTTAWHWSHIGIGGKWVRCRFESFNPCFWCWEVCALWTCEGVLCVFCLTRFSLFMVQHMSRPEDLNGQNWFSSWLSLGTNKTWDIGCGFWSEFHPWPGDGGVVVGHQSVTLLGRIKKLVGWRSRSEQLSRPEQTSGLLESEQRGQVGWFGTFDACVWCTCLVI